MVVVAMTEASTAAVAKQAEVKAHQEEQVAMGRMAVLETEVAVMVVAGPHIGLCTMRSEPTFRGEQKHGIAVMGSDRANTTVEVSKATLAKAQKVRWRW